jgi:hypothetical protein
MHTKLKDLLAALGADLAPPTIRALDLVFRRPADPGADDEVFTYSTINLGYTDAGELVFSIRGVR